MTGQSPEKLLISAVLQTGSAQLAMTRGVTRDWFHALKPQWVWIENHVSQFGKAPDIGTFVAKFPNVQLYRSTDVDYAVEEMRSHHMRASFGSLMADITDELLRGAPAADMISKAQKRLGQLQGQIEGGQNEITLEDHDEPYLDLLRRTQQAQTTGAPGVKTGFTTLDKISGGPSPGDLWIVAARLGQGKTWTMIKMATEAVMAGHTVLFQSLEQSRVQIMFRMHSFLARAIGGPEIKVGDLMRGSLPDPFVYRDFLQELPLKVPGQLIVNDTARGRLTVAGLSAQVERHNPSIVFVDYLGLMATPGEWASVAEVSAGLKGVASRHRIPVVTAAQINRAGAGASHNPGAEHLAGSDAIGQDADLVLTMRQRSAHCLTYSVVKHRHGRSGVNFHGQFQPNVGLLTECSQEQAEELMAKDREAEDQ